MHDHQNVSYSHSDTEWPKRPGSSLDFLTIFENHKKNTYLIFLYLYLGLFYKRNFIDELSGSDVFSTFYQNRGEFFIFQFHFYLAIHKLQYTKRKIQYIYKSKNTLQKEIRYNAKDSSRKSLKGLFSIQVLLNSLI